jgi:acyl dehydratase
MFPQTVLTAMSKLRFIQPVQNEDTVEVSGVVKDITLMPERGGAAVEISMRFRVNKKLVIGGSVIAFTRLPTE